jgi:hypothetical protein
MKSLLRVILIAMVVFGAYAAVSSKPAQAKGIAMPTPNCLCVPNQN